jgi:hypothetical protein
MMTLNSFKKQLGVEKLKFMKSEKTGQQYLTVGTEKVFLSKKADLEKELFVIVNDGSKVVALKGTWWITNGADLQFPSRVDYKAQMLGLPSSTLVEVFNDLYKLEYGQTKLNDIIKSVSSDVRMKGTLQSMMAQRIDVNAGAILKLLNTKTTFVFSKSETLCVGAMEVVMVWHKLYLDKIKFVTALAYENTELLEGLDKIPRQLIVDVVLACNNLKSGIGRNFFDKYYDLIWATYVSDFR